MTSQIAYVVWPPVWNAFDPHVAVPALCGYLAGQGIPFRQWDLNIDFFRYLTSEEVIEEQLGNAPPPLPPNVRNAADFARAYYDVLRRPLQAGYQQRFSEDAEELLLNNALAIFNHFHRETSFSTLGVYHSGDAEDSDFIAEFVARDAGNPFAAFYRKVFLPSLARERPAIVGISVCGSFQLGAAFTLARMIKEVEPLTSVVIGGAFFSTTPQVLQASKTASNLFRHVDAFILNEGELPFAGLIRQVFSGAPPEPAPNVVTKGDRQLRYEARYCLPADEIAVPVFPDGALEKYFRPVPRIPIEVSRGCYWGKCTFCNLPTGANERYRGIPIENICRAATVLTGRHGTRHVLFSTLAMAPKALRELATRLLSDKMHLSWSAWIRPEKTLTKADFELCKEAGCTSLAVTPESFNDRTLARMEKGVTREHLIRIVGVLTEVGLCGWVNLIPGFPGETIEDFRSTLEVCRDLGLRGEFFPFCLLKNSTIYKQPERFGVVLREQTEKDLGVPVPFIPTNDSAMTGLELIRMAAGEYPGRVFADNPATGYIFDFSRPAVRSHA